MKYYDTKNIKLQTAKQEGIKGLFLLIGSEQVSEVPMEVATHNGAGHRSSRGTEAMFRKDI